MKTFLRIIGALIVVCLAALLAFIFVPVQRTAPTEELAADWTPEAGQGEYVMYASDCMACHTAEGGEPFAGGRSILSPMGTIWATNITPDKETGIGNWTLDDFRAALYDGLTPDGRHLYPAMPYENYRKLTEEDVRALYDYFMNEVPAVNNPVEATALSFPFNMRFGIRAWNWIALSDPAGSAYEQSTPQERGRYLVESAGHCGACHSPRNVFMGQDGLTADDANFLKGGEVDGWLAPALMGEGSAAATWPVGEIATYLATGRNSHSTANGEMSMVVEHSLQHLTDEDNLAIAAFLKGEDVGEATLLGTDLALEEAENDHPTTTMLTEAKDLSEGARLYLDNCNACHFVTGKGAPEIFPELAGNSLVTADQTGPLIGIILHGAEVPSTEKRPMRLVMQGYAERLTDEEVAEVASFLRTAWGNDAPAVTAADVAKVRAADSAH
ncbi:cytochrome c [Falsirhodobacter sp. 20TX0035]|uniref:cytochrome c n=1 Tax=Falsirhodobacter sp. 20TX0035 TaxID=3022019 RepID=UPI00232C994D|nr:cytochrome c [Falsirhodobacter sp. 20TX0035]MDB6453620.1 cytochrome c [Falsirhodobacter sp. 20TX0035]